MMTGVPIGLEKWAGFASNLATVLGVLTAAVLFWWDRRKEFHSRAIAAYLDLNEEYQKYLQRCINDPNLAAIEDSGGDRKQDLHLCMVLSMLECAFFMYHDQSGEFKERQWAGWSEYMKEWCKQLDLQGRWEWIDTYDSGFIEYMNKLRA